MKKIFLIIALFIYSFSNAQNNFIYDMDKVTVFQNNKACNFEIYGNNDLQFQDSSCIVFFSPCGNCCAEYSIIILKPEPHLKIYKGVKEINFQEHYLIKEDSIGRLAAMNFLNEKIFWARSFFYGNSKNGDCLYFCSLTDNILTISFDTQWVTENNLIYPYKPNKTYSFKLPEK